MCRRFKFCTLWCLLIALVVFAAGCRPSSNVPTPVAHVAGTPTLAVAGASTPTPMPGEPLAARVNGQPIRLQEYQKQVAEWEAAFVGQNPNLSEADKQAMIAQGKQQVLDVMIEQVLIEQAAAQAGIVISDQDVESVVARDIQDNGGQAKFEAWLQTNNWTVDEYRSRQRSMMIASRMFEHITRDVPTKAEQVHARHILVATEQEARTILSQLQGGTDFVALAAQHSLDPSTKDSGGDLGFFPRGTLVVPEVENTAFSLGVGQISDVFSSAMGYHIVQVIERVPDMTLTEESWQSLKETTFRRWLLDLWDTASIEVLVSP
ncbi:MAG: peptidylprolyl isomerase [Anaerolineae bacterium]|nr:peptidylprolyl isomerase [Anaerolineae bacterium]